MNIAINVLLLASCLVIVILLAFELKYWFNAKKDEKTMDMKKMDEEKEEKEFQELKKCFEQKGMIGIEDLVYVPVDLSGMEIIREYVKEEDEEKEND